MFKIGDILNQRYLLKQPLATSQNGRQTWLAIDLGSHEFGLFWRWEKLNNIDWLNTLKPEVLNVEKSATKSSIIDSIKS